ncbi:MAG: PilZ domain-containing protein [Deltaproteobacteria bacterium]|nr:PilZ domain-containing protein [Deltaproteobacteria bacterium]MBW2120917.1 PilZ domain-containing protein [Deltaproteobacteria bacterium]
MPKRRDRRRSRRIKDPVLIFLYRDRLGNKDAVPLDLGLEGIGIRTKDPLTRGDQLEITIVIGECQIRAQGTVVYSKEEESGYFRSGISFKEISERNKGIIRLYLEKTRQPGRNKRNEPGL